MMKVSGRRMKTSFSRDSDVFGSRIHKYKFYIAKSKEINLYI